MSLQVNIQVNDTATPVLARLHQELRDRIELNRYIAAAAEAGTRIHIRVVAQQRHTTAERLGSQPTGYLAKRAEMVEGKGDSSGARITVTGAIFRRVLGPVVIRPKSAKMLTIPWRAEAHGRRAREFEGLFVYRSKQGKLFLAKRDGQRIKFLFLLKAQVTLPQDRGLLPTEEQYGQAGELAARGYLRKILREEGIAA